MSSSQTTFCKSRRYTYIALFLGATALAGIVAAIIQVDALERTYGTIRSDIQRYTRERDDAVVSRDGVLKDISLAKAQEEALRKTLAELQADKQKLDADVVSQNDRLATATKKFSDISARSQAADDTISKAAQAEKDLAALKMRAADQAKLIQNNDSRIAGLNTEIEDAERKKEDAVASATDVQRQQDQLENNIKSLRSDVEDLDVKKRELSEVSAQTKRTQADLSQATKDLTDKTRQSSSLQSELTSLQAAVAKAKDASASATNEIADLEQQKAVLSKELTELERARARVSGEAATLEAASERARADAADAQGRQTAADNALARLNQSIPVARAEIDALKAEVATVASQRDALLGEVSDLKAAKAAFALDKSGADRARAEKEALEREVADQQKQLDQTKRESEIEAEKVAKLREDLALLNGRKGSLSQEVDTLSASKAALQPKSGE